jgi:hypothetical protein
MAEWRDAWLLLGRLGTPLLLFVLAIMLAVLGGPNEIRTLASENSRHG